jgi:hypothetical protein
MQVNTEGDNILACSGFRFHVAHLITAYLVISRITNHVSTAFFITDSTHDLYCLGISGSVLKHPLIPCRRLSASAAPAAVAILKGHPLTGR